MRYEIFRKISCKPEEKSMSAWLLNGRSRIGQLTTEHSASSYGHPVVIVSEWGGLVDYSDIQKICILKDDSDSENDMVVECKRLEGKFASFGIKISWS